MFLLPRKEPVPDLPQSFGYKNAWYALATTDTDAVVKSLGLIEAQSANWATGIQAAYANQVFVTPPVGEWTLVVGFTLFDAEEPEITVKPVLERLSRTFLDTQFYATHRVVEYHLWARAQRGDLTRGFAYLGESGQILWDEGAASADELALGLKFSDQCSTEAAEHRKRESMNFPNEQAVMSIAARWSICPTELEGKFTQPGLGVVCHLPKKR